MKCFSPVSVMRPNGKGPKDRVTVPCGKCLSCLTRKRCEWSFRLREELRHCQSAYFVTLTYDDENVPFDRKKSEDRFYQGDLNKRDVQLFIKRLRKAIDTRVEEIEGREKVSEMKEKGQNLRYYLVGEYGDKTNRPHYHGIFFNLPLGYGEILTQTWKKGFVNLGTVTEASIHYVTKYCITTKEMYSNREVPFAMISGKPGLGYQYMKRAYKFHKENQAFYGVMPGGNKVNLPRYYREKFFNIQEKQKHFDEMVSKHDRRELDRIDALIEGGDNPFYDEMQNNEQKLINTKRVLIKKSKL